MTPMDDWRATVKEKARAGVSFEAQLGKDLWSAGFSNSLAAELSPQKLACCQLGAAFTSWQQGPLLDCSLERNPAAADPAKPCPNS